MGRRTKQLSHLDEQECQWILGVIHRDFELRHREQQRLSKIERELNEAANQRNLLAKRKEFNEKCCILCCATFNLLFNKRLLCTQCKCYVCRNCASWESQEKKWLCRVCEQQHLLYVQSCEWFYDHIKQRFKHFGSAKVLDTLRRKRKESGVDSENDSGYGPATEGHSLKISPLSFLLPRANEKTKPNHDDNAAVQPGNSNGEEDDDDQLAESSEVRRHIETVVQGLIGETLDTARVDRPFLHPQYMQLFSSFHSRIVEAITKLCQALDIALNNKPLPEGEGASAVTPTTAHASLKQAILEVGQQANSLPALQELPEASSSEHVSGGDFMTSCLFHSYQELLASAIINKLVEQGQKRFNPSPQLTREDSELSDISDTDIHMNSAANDIGCSDHSGGSESESLETESSLGGVDAADEFSWASGIKDGGEHQPRIEYVIEECIEEITETEEEITDAEGNNQRRQEGEREKQPYHRSVSRLNSGVDDTVTRATFDVPSGSSVPDLDFLNAWDIVEKRRVPFPEFGVDIVEDRLWDEPSTYYNDEGEEEEIEAEDFDEVGSRRASISAWEENWLFRKRKMFPFGSLRHQLLGFYGEPPCMLIPNPRDIPSSQAQIDSRDVDQLSELSEHNSGGSLEFSDSESESELTVSHKLAQLAQNVAQHFNSTTPSVNSNTFQTNAECLVTKSRPFEKEVRPVVKSKDTYSAVKHLPSQSLHKVEDCLTVPRYAPPNQRPPPGRDPYFVIPPEGLSLHAGKIAHFQCQVKGTKPLGVAWFQGNLLLQNSDRVEIYQPGEESHHILNIYDTEIEDTGSYSCVVYGKKFEQWADFNLQVRGTTRGTLPPEFVVPLRLSECGELGGKVRITCTLSGYPEPRLQLFHNKKPLEHSSKHIIECLGYGEWHVDINQVDSLDEGDYEAFAKNCLGRAHSILHLKLRDALFQSPKPSQIQTEEMVKETRKSEVKGHQRERPYVLQRTWLERCAEMEPKGKINRFLLQPLEHPINGPQDLSPPSPAPQDLSCPPRPGTIAEREHRKWETAAPLPNNPYSQENLSKRRLERRISDISLTDPPMSFEEFEKQRDLNDASGRCENEHYSRDYYVNQPKSSTPYFKVGSKHNSDTSANGHRDESLNALQDKVYLSADHVNSLEGQVRLLERELERVSAPNQLDQLQTQVARTVAQVDDSSRQVSRVECELRKLRKTISSESDHSKVSKGSFSDGPSPYKVTSEEEVEDPSSLPSVKHLANLFTPSPTHNNNNHNHNFNGVHSKSPYPEKDVVIVGKAVLPATSSSQVAAQIQQQQQSSQVSKYKVANQVAPPPPQLEEERVNQDRPWPLVRQLSRSFDNNNNNDSSNDSYPAASVQRVHSLTARSMSKEFRQQTQRHMPRPMNRTVSVVSPSSGSSSSQPTSLDTDRSVSPASTTPYNSTSNLSLPAPVFPTSTNHIRQSSDSGQVGSGGGYTSDESSASNTSLPRSSTKRRPISKNILQRATYWERRAEQSLLSDNSVGEEFPLSNND